MVFGTGPSVTEKIKVSTVSCSMNSVQDIWSLLLPTMLTGHCKIAIENCNWTSHFDYIIKNASRRFYALRLLRPSLTNVELKLVYSALVRSVIEYCSPLFLGMTSTDKQRLERLQKRFHKMLCGQYCDAECLISLEDRRMQLSLKFLQKMNDKNHILHHELPPLSSTGRFILPPRCTNRRSRSFIPLVCEISNSLFNRQ